MVKKVCATRWKSRVNAVKAIRYQTVEVYNALISIADDVSLTGPHGTQSCAEAKGIAQKCSISNLSVR